MNKNLSENFKFNNLVKSLLKYTKKFNLNNLLLTYSITLIAIYFYCNDYELIFVFIIFFTIYINNFIHKKLNSFSYMPYLSLKKKHVEFKALNLNKGNDSFEWFQTILDLIWPLFIIEKIQYQLNSMYDAQKNEFLSSFFKLKFKNFYLDNTISPNLSKIKIIEKDKKDKIVIRCEMVLFGKVVFVDMNKKETKNELMNILDFYEKKNLDYDNVDLKKRKTYSKNLCLRGKAQIVIQSFSKEGSFCYVVMFNLLEKPSFYTGLKVKYKKNSQKLQTLIDCFLQCMLNEICKPFLSPKKIYLKYNEKNFFFHKQMKFLNEKMKNLSPKLVSKLKLINSHEKLIAFFLANDGKDLNNWYKLNMIPYINVVSSEINQKIFYPIPSFFCIMKIFELHNLPIEFNQIEDERIIILKINLGNNFYFKIQSINNYSPVISNSFYTALFNNYYDCCKITIYLILNLSILKIYTNEYLILDEKLKMITRDLAINNLKEIGFVSFEIKKNIFKQAEEENSNFKRNCEKNLYDFWLPILKTKKTMIHLKCSLIELKEEYSVFLDTMKTLDKEEKKVLQLKQCKLNLPLASVIVYVESFELNLEKDKNRICKNLYYKTSLKMAHQHKEIDSNKVYEHKILFQRGEYFLINENPFNLCLIVELFESNKAKKSKLNLSSNLDVQQNENKIFNIVHLNKFKNKVDSNKFNLQSVLPLYIASNEKEHTKIKNYLTRLENEDYSFSEDDLNNFDKYGEIYLSIFIRFIKLDSNTLKNLNLPTELRGLTGKRKQKASFKNCFNNCFTQNKEIKNQILDENLSLKTNVQNNILDENVCKVKLYFKLIKDDLLEIGIVEVYNLKFNPNYKKKIQAIIELWKGNNMFKVKKTKFVHAQTNQYFNCKLYFELSSSYLLQYSIQFKIIQKSGLIKHNHHLIANKFCSLPVLNVESDIIYRLYILQNHFKSPSPKSLNTEERIFP